MNFETSVDFEAEEVTIVYDDSIVLKITKLEDNEYKYLNFHKIDDEDGLGDIFKALAKSLLSR